MFNLKRHKRELRGENFMKKIITLVCILTLTMLSASAESINKAISDSGINKSAISISVRDTKTGKILYKLNDKKPVTPASTLKAVTFAASLNELGKDYEFTTALYKNTNNDLILKLGADPFLKTGDLEKLIETAKSKNVMSPKSFIIDDTITDNIEWGEGWQWTDELNPYMPKFSVWNLDGNLITVSFEPTVEGAPADIKLSVFYPITFMNYVTTGSPQTGVKITRNTSIAPNIYNAEGTINKTVLKQLPVLNQRLYFTLRLENAVKELEYYGNIKTGVLPGQNIYLIDKITTGIDKASQAIMLESNNTVSESLFKLAAAHYTNSAGTTKNAINMLQNYCEKLNVNTDDIKIVDASGVSKNNLVTADFMTSFLTAQYKKDNNYKKLFATAGNGTLENRMLYFGKHLRAKTGTLSDVSAITGFITTASGKTLAFDIMINDAKSKPSEKKMLEEYILRAIRNNY